MKKFLLIALLCVIAGVSICFIFTRPEMNNTTKIICKYFENTKKKLPEEDIDVVSGIDFNYGHVTEDMLPEVIEYQGALFQFSMYTIDKEAVYTKKNVEEDFYDYFNRNNLKENIYELKNTFLTYGFAYKYKDIYYLYFCMDNELGGSAEDFDELLKGINANHQLRFYEVEVGIETFKGHNYLDKDIVCYGDVNKLFEECIKGKKLKNMRMWGNDGRMTITNRTNVKKASIRISGYMEDVGIAFTLSMKGDGYLNLSTDSLRIDTCFEMSDELIEEIFQYIIQNFEIYVRSETKTK